MRGLLRKGIRKGLYVLIATLCLVATKLLFRLRVSGRRHMHPDEGYIAVARHRSYWDIPVMAAALGVFNCVHFISRKGLMRGIPVVRAVIRTFSTIIDRENFGRDDFRRMLAAMRTERLIGLFPEGTTREQVDAKSGTVHFARLSGKKILPVNIAHSGPYPPKFPFKLSRLSVSIGEAFDVSDLCESGDDALSRAEQTRQMSERLMQRVDNA